MKKILRIGFGRNSSRGWRSVMEHLSAHLLYCEIMRMKIFFGEIGMLLLRLYLFHHQLTYVYIVQILSISTIWTNFQNTITATSPMFSRSPPTKTHTPCAKGASRY